MFEVKNVENDVGLSAFRLKFICERVDVNVILATSDQDLTPLGISTFGNRWRLRDACRGRKPHNIPASGVTEVSQSWLLAVVASYKFKSTSYEFKSTIYKFKSTS